MEGYQFFEHLTWFSVKLLRQSGRIRVGERNPGSGSEKGRFSLPTKG